MDFPPKKMMVVGDRVLISAEGGEERTRVGLYLPATAIDTQPVQEGMIVATGPGDPVLDKTSPDYEGELLDTIAQEFHAHDNLKLLVKRLVKLPMYRRMP